VEKCGDHGARFSPDQRRSSIVWSQDGVLARDRRADEALHLLGRHPGGAAVLWQLRAPQAFGGGGPNSALFSARY
jgi:hypothetical protein